MSDERRYEVVRFFFGQGGEVIASGLTLEEAQEHCNDPETSSRTCTSEAGLQLTRERGQWFDGYREEDGFVASPRSRALREFGRQRRSDWRLT